MLKEEHNMEIVVFLILCCWRRVSSVWLPNQTSSAWTGMFISLCGCLDSISTSVGLASNDGLLLQSSLCSGYRVRLTDRPGEHLCPRTLFYIDQYKNTLHSSLECPGQSQHYMVKYYCIIITLYVLISGWPIWIFFNDQCQYLGEQGGRYIRQYSTILFG